MTFFLEKLFQVVFYALTYIFSLKSLNSILHPFTDFGTRTTFLKDVNFVLKV